MPPFGAEDADEVCLPIKEMSMSFRKALSEPVLAGWESGARCGSCVLLTFSNIRRANCVAGKADVWSFTFHTWVASGC